MSATSNAQYLVRSYLFLRKSLGYIGIALPFVLIIGKILLESPGISDSISSYYYSVMRNVFVGILCAIGIFLICYRYELLPTAPNVGATDQQVIIGWLHLLFAVCFFFFGERIRIRTQHVATTTSSGLLA